MSELIDTEQDPNFNVTYEFIDSIYSSVVQVLQAAAACFVPARKKSFYKFWWFQELDDLKDRAILSHKLWKEAGCPRTGPIFDLRNKDKREYRIFIRMNEQHSTERFT